MSDYSSRACHTWPALGRRFAAAALCLGTAAASSAYGQLAYTDLAGGLAVNSIQFNTIVAPVTSTPIGGYQPLVAVSMTNEETADDLDYFAYNATDYLANGLSGAHALASNASPYYHVALLDTGAQVHLLTDQALTGFDFAGNNLLGTNQIPISGVGGTEFATIQDPAGIYITGFNNATGGASLSLNTSTLVGQYNVSVVSADDPSTLLPDVVGLPLASQYATVIRTDQRKQIVVGTDVYESPNVELLPFDDPSLPNYTNEATLFLLEGAAFSTPPFFLIGFDNLEDFHDNPLAPTSTPGAMFLSGDITHHGTHLAISDMFLDTGAQVTVISHATAIDLGINLVAEPEFTVEIQGAGGAVEAVPGYFLDNFSLDTDEGFALTNVPVLVMDVPDPRDGVNPVPAIVGTNLFHDRNIVIHPEPIAGQSKLYISDIVTIPGDLNSDGFVGLDDLDILLNHWNQEVTDGYLFSGDPNGDGYVGLDDLDIVLNHWNEGTPPASVIPEPTTLLVVSLSGAMLLKRRMS